MHYPPKDLWGPGPWQVEPDRVEWRYRGLPCLIVRSPVTGALCGYAACSPRHPLHGADFYTTDLDVHGGLSFGGLCSGRICHKPRPGEPKHAYWLGFDCAHAFDYMPAFGVFSCSSLSRVGTYRDLAFVRAEVERLADQIVALAAPVPLHLRRLRARAARRHESAERKAAKHRAGCHRRWSFESHFVRQWVNARSAWSDVWQVAQS